MRRVLGLILIGLAVACLVAAPLLKFYAVPKLAVAPLDVDPNKPSRNSGTAVKLLDFATLTERTNVPLTSIRYTRADIPATQQ
ncbi:porin PorA family protein, partial [Enterococcus faecium]|uniref:porin PorA family protein n=1 Tax=Enterococcus faecium TaxID=1352 RepID=UPI003F435E76